MNAGIVGFGFVGKAIYYGSNRKSINFLVNDSNPDILPEKYSTIEEICSKCPIIFVCVPTPTNFRTNMVDTSIVEEVIRKINKQNKHNIVIIKSTIPPNTTENLQSKYRNIIILFCPEFLREVSFIDDYAKQSYIIIGIPKQINTKHLWYKKIKKIIKNFYFLSLTDNPNIFFTESTLAELTKYTINTFLTSKVAFFNIIYQLCQKLNISYDVLRALVLLDNRIGDSHTQVPGPDGKLGFGGKCFCKDLVGLIGAIDSAGSPEISIILKTIWNFNCKIRPEKDWLQIKGVSSE